MLETMVTNTRELNKVANYLRNQKEIDRLRKLAETWQVPYNHVTEFIAGKRVLLADIDVGEKEYTTVNAKLAEELHILDDVYFADAIGAYVCRKANNAVYRGRIMKRHKSLQKCLDYVLRKALEEAEEKYGKEKMRAQNGVGITLSDAQVFQWVDDYYALEDEKQEAEKREKAKKEFLEEKQERIKREKKAKEWKGMQDTAQKKKEEKERREKEAKENVQLSFDFLSSSTESETEEEVLQESVPGE